MKDENLGRLRGVFVNLQLIEKKNKYLQIFETYHENRKAEINKNYKLFMKCYI